MSGNSFALISALFFLISIHGHAQNLDAASGQALKQTQSLLQNPSKREEFSKNSAKAKAAEAYVNKITGGNTKTSQEIYSLASDVFANVVKGSHGDPAKMQKELEKFSRNPAAFAATWTPEQREKLRELSKQLPTLSGQQN